MNRIIELLIALLFLVILIPLILLIFIILSLSYGSAIYKQNRVGINGKVFVMYKFRTMIKNAERNGHIITKDYGDKRITRFGRILRVSNLDELLQLFNIIKGDMAFVGPRPERPFFHKEFCKTIPNWDNRLKVKPGVTGLAQLKGKTGFSPKDKLKYDLAYIKKKSTIYDLRLLFKTLFILYVISEKSKY